MTAPVTSTERARSSFDEDSVMTLALADIDADRDLDLLVGNNTSQNRVITNVTHQLAWRALPRIGYPLTLDLRGPAFAPWQLYVERGDETHGSDPQGHEPRQLVASGNLDVNGIASYTTSIPQDCHLVGHSWRWQAVIGGAPSNLEITTFKGL